MSSNPLFFRYFRLVFVVVIVEKNNDFTMAKNKKKKDDSDKKLIKKLLKDKVLTRMMIEEQTSIRRESICSHIDSLRKHNDLIVAYRLPCFVTGYVAEWITMNERIVEAYRRRNGLGNQLDLFGGCYLIWCLDILNSCLLYLQLKTML